MAVSLCGVSSQDASADRGARCLAGAMNLGHLAQTRAPLLVVTFATPAWPAAADSVLKGG